MARTHTAYSVVVRVTESVSALLLCRHTIQQVRPVDQHRAQYTYTHVNGTCTQPTFRMARTHTAYSVVARVTESVIECAAAVQVLHPASTIW